jgi:hypothetical protein
MFKHKKRLELIFLILNALVFQLQSYKNYINV